MPNFRSFSRPKALPKSDLHVDAVEILYEDEALIAVNKPARLPMHANLDLSRDHLVGVLTRQLEERDGTPGYLGIHQRLDWGTSGVVVFTRCKEVNAAIAQQFETHSLEKVYLAIVAGNSWPSRPAWRVTVPLGEPKCKGGRVQLGTGKALPAATNFRLLRRAERGAWVEARLETGRKHQVRAHLLSCGLHIYGDELYSAPDAPWCRGLQRAMLHAYTLTLKHPLSGQELRLRAPLPDDMVALAAKLKLGKPHD